MSAIVKPYLVSPRELYSFKKHRNTYYVAIMIKEPPCKGQPGYEDAFTEGKGNVLHIPITKKQYDLLIKHKVE